MSMVIERMGRMMGCLVCAVLVMALVSGCKQEGEAVKKAAQPVPVPVLETKSEAAPSANPAAVLVEVDGATLTVGEADKQIAAMLGPQAAGLDAERMAAIAGRFRKQVADRFVMRTLLEQEAVRRNIAVKNEDVEAAVTVIKGRLPEGMTLEAALAGEGLTEAQFRSNLVSELKVKGLVESQVPTNVVVSDEEIAKVYEEDKSRFVQEEGVQARHILVKFDAADDDKAKAAKKDKVESLQKQLAAGADFEKLAKENSDCPSKERGGDLGVFRRGQMVKPFEDAAFSQPVSQIGPVVETSFGYHVIQVTGRTEAKTNTLAEVKDRLGEHLKQRKQMEAFEGFIDQLKSSAKIAYGEVIKAGAAE